MRNFNENIITDAMIERIKDASDPRIKKVSEALVRHFHAFVREVRPTQAEWEYGIDFPTRTGHTCDGKRQEFILLSDALGVSMLVADHPICTPLHARASERGTCSCLYQPSSFMLFDIH